MIQLSKNKIVLRLAGGLGNQLFQFSAAIILARRRSLPFESILIDTRFLASYDAKHEYEISFISDFFPGVQVGPQHTLFASMASRFRLAKIFDKKLGSFELISSVAHLNAVCSSRSTAANFILDGYFQHTDVLFAEDDRIRIRAALLSARCSLIDQVKAGFPTIGVHIRRGDYVTSKSAAKVFRNIPIEYYDEAIMLLGCKKRILVFSDDRYLSARYAARIGGVDVRKLNLSLQDEFSLLMSCDDHIIANSTFSWWAAYFGHKVGGRVIAPKLWYHSRQRSDTNPLLLPYFDLIDA